MYSRISIPEIDRIDGAGASGPAMSAAAAAFPASASAWPAGPRAMPDGAFFRDIRSPVTIFILRHGRSEGNATGTYQGRIEYPLDDVGRAQARAAGKWLAARKPDAIVCSPQLRAAETAGIVAAACGLGEPVRLPSLAEVDTGIFSGLDNETASRLHPEIFREFEGRSWDAVPGAENSASMHSRAIASWESMRALAAGGAPTIACVTHGGLLQWIVRSTFGGSTWLPLLPMGNCGIYEYSIEPTTPGHPAFVQWRLMNFIAPVS